MLGMKILAAIGVVGLAGIISSEHIDSWAKLTAIPILGGLIVLILWLNHKEKQRASETTKSILATHEKVCDGIKCEIHDIGEANKATQSRLIELQEKHLGKVEEILTESRLKN